MRVVAVTRVLDEADVVEAFARHTAAFVDHHLFLDNGSRDGTLAILSALHAEGLPITVWQARNVSFNEAGHLTQMFRIAVRDHGADWVACLDADEFVDDRSPVPWRDLLRALGEADPAVACLHLPSADYVSTSHDDAAEPLVPRRMTRRRPLDGANGKAVARGGPARLGAAFTIGGHAVAPGGDPDGPLGLAVMQPGLRLAHFGERSPYQALLKIVRGWSLVLAAPVAVADSGTAHHYRHPFEVLRDQPAELLRTGWMGFKDESPDLVHDPVAYRGGPLRHTAPQDEAMRSVQALMGVLEGLALRHRRLLDTFPEVGRGVAGWDAEMTRLL